MLYPDVCGAAVGPDCAVLSCCFQADSVRSMMTAVPSYTRSKQARGYKAFTRRSCPTFPLCASAAGLRCIIHEHSVNLLIQNMSSLFLCLIYCLSFLSLCHTPSLLLLHCFPLLLLGWYPAAGRRQRVERRGDRLDAAEVMEVDIIKGVTMKNAETVNKR